MFEVSALLNLLFYGIIVGILALVFSILHWRLKTPILFTLGVVFSTLVLVIYLFNVELFIELFSNQDSILTGVILLIFLILPAGFLIASKTKSTNPITESEVTDDYLNEIINSEDENIEFD